MHLYKHFKKSVDPKFSYLHQINNPFLPQIIVHICSATSESFWDSLKLDKQNELKSSEIK